MTFFEIKKKFRFEILTFDYYNVFNKNNSIIGQLYKNVFQAPNIQNKHYNNLNKLLLLRD